MYRTILPSSFDVICLYLNAVDDYSGYFGQTTFIPMSSLRLETVYAIGIEPIGSS